MSEEISYDRRCFLSKAAITIAGTQLAMIGLTEAQTHTSFASVKQINAGVLNIGYADVGPAAGPPVVLLHGWPYDVHSYVDVAPLLASRGYRVIVPFSAATAPRRSSQAARFATDSNRPSRSISSI